MTALTYYETMLPRVLEKWADIRLSIFNNNSPKSKKAWQDIKELLGACPWDSNVNKFFHCVSKQVRKQKTAIRAELVPLFEQLERLRAEAEVEREKAELQFALALAEKFTGEERAIRSTILQVAARLKDNIFVATRLRIREVLSMTRKGFMNQQSVFSRAQLVYLHLIGIEVPFEKCWNKDIEDDLSVSWKAALKKSFKKEPTGNGEKQEKEHGGPKPARRRSSAIKAVDEVVVVDEDDEGNLKDVSRKRKAHEAVDVHISSQNSPREVRDQQSFKNQIVKKSQEKISEDEMKKESARPKKMKMEDAELREQEKLTYEIFPSVERARCLFEEGRKDVAMKMLRETICKVQAMSSSEHRELTLVAIHEICRKHSK